MTPEERRVLDLAIEWGRAVEFKQDTVQLLTSLEEAAWALILACPRCNTDRHQCPGCGAPIGHTATDCGTGCTEEPGTQRCPKCDVTLFMSGKCPDCEQYYPKAELQPLAQTELHCEECCDEDPASWCDCRVDETCKGPCRKRAHDPDRCPTLAAWIPAVIWDALAGDKIRAGSERQGWTEGEVTRRYAAKIKGRQALMADLTCRPGMHPYPLDFAIEIWCTPERKAQLTMQQGFPGSEVIGEEG